ncbi:MAG: hypothetical protein IT443_04585 [Phycisphaeraceae bacterium]|nr:hypothetical protein [Phycisphaeraceae bacterium]
MPQVLIAQLDSVWQDPSANIAAARHLLRAQTIEPGSLVVLPEMYATGFCPSARKLAEPIDGPAQQFLAEKAARTGAWVMGGVMVRPRPRKSSSKAYNEAIAFDPQCREVVRYRKMNLFPLAGEKEHISAGRKIATFPWQGFAVMPAICYDLRFPELFRAGVQAGANLFVVLANWPAARVEHWTTLLRARAIETQAYVLGVNRSGSDPHAQYPGASLVVDPRGQIMAQAGSEPCVLKASVELSHVESWRNEFPAWRQMQKPRPGSA